MKLKNYDFSSKKDQLNCFETQINVSQTINKPIVIHSRDADEDMIKILTSEYKKGSFKAILHCFSSGKKLALCGVELGFYISFSGIVTFNSAKLIQEVAMLVPKDKILVETDAPYLAPVPKRGKRNEPSFLEYTLKEISIIKNLKPDEIAEKTTSNFFQLFDKIKK